MTDQTEAPTAARPIYAKLAVIGCGLIGSSVIRAARARGVVGEVAVADLEEVTERSEERRGGKESRIGCRSRWSRYD